MCGISGFLGDFDEHVLQDVTDAIAHRGPDGQGIWLEKNDKIGLGHRRLSILDLSEAAAQPMESADGRYITTFNGEIYNFKSFHEDLTAQGYSFNKNSDTAILAPLYDAYGPEMLERLNGIFAFAIWDKKEKRLFIVRDHVGAKPLYYTEHASGLAFCSELKGLLALPDFDKTLDEEALLSYLTYLWCPGAPTMFKAVRKLLPGHYMLAKVGQKAEMCQWYKTPLPKIINGKPVYMSEKKGGASCCGNSDCGGTGCASMMPQAEMLKDLLDEVMADQIVSDVPVGAFLSGGVDSSAVVASMAANGNKPAASFCIGFEGQGMASEGFSADMPYARQVAEKIQVPLTEIRAEPDGLLGLKEMVWALDEPQADPAPMYVRTISKVAKEQGIKVLMGGTGGDDVFSGYRRHQTIMMLEKLKFVPTPLLKFALGAGKFLPIGENLKRRIQKIKQLIGDNMENTLVESFKTFAPPQVMQRILSGDLKKVLACRGADHLERQVEESRGQHPLNRVLHLEMQGFLPDHNLNYTDKLGMLEGVEIRVPLLDPRLMTFGAQIPPNLKVHGKEAKWLFKKSQEGRLPQDVLWRSKAGFGAPMRQWLTQDYADFTKDVLFGSKLLQRGLFDRAGVEQLYADTVTGKVDGTYTLLSLMVIELWMQCFVDKEK